MKRLKTTVALISAAMLLLTACGTEKVQTEKKGNANVSAVNEFPIVEEPITLSVFSSKDASIEDIATNEFTKWYEEKTNIKIDWNLVTGDVRQAINLQLASDDFSDIFKGFGFARSEQIAYYNQGVFIDLTDLVEENAYYIKKMFEERPDFEEQVRHYENKILGIPSIASDFSAESSNKMWIYKPWLDKLGAKVPETTEEFYELLKRFKTEDPNGNGKADEIPLAGRDLRGNPVGLDMFIMNAFTTWSRFGFAIEDGKAVFAPITDEAKEGIRYMRKLYKEGLIHPESFVMSRSAISAIAENNVPILGAAPAKWTTQFTVAGAPSGRMNEYVAVPPLEGPNGFRQSLGSAGGDAGCTSFSITSNCQYPEAALKWVDWFYSEEAYMTTKATEGFRYAKEGELGLDGKQARFTLEEVENATVGDAIQNKRWLSSAWCYWPVENTISVCDKTIDGVRQKICYEAYELYKPYEVTGTVLNDFPVPAELSETYLEYRSNITAAIDSGFVSFIIGEKDIDKDWDAYVKRFYDLGLEDYQKIIQDYLDSLK